MDRQLIDYLPPVLRDVREYSHVTAAEQPEVDALWSEAAKALDNATVLTADEYGVARWERMLGITPPATRTLEDRRFLVLARLNAKLPITEAVLRQQLAALCGPAGYTLQVMGSSFVVDVKVELTAKHNFEDVGSMLRRSLPANMSIALSLLYNQHLTLAQRTHAQLSAFTHNQLRNEVV